MTSSTRRAALALAILGGGLAAEAAVERATRIERPSLVEPLATIPMELGDWVGRDVPVDPDILRESQATECVNRVYQHRGDRQSAVSLWINYSETGQNLRHSPTKCLPSAGYEPIEAMTRALDVPGPGGAPQRISLLGYGQGGSTEPELVQKIGFWYYIFGEGRIERFVRGLPVTSRSSHGRTTRGSGLTVEVFYRGDAGIDDAAIGGFVAELLAALEPRLPGPRASYYIP